MITITIDDLAIEKAAILALAQAFQGSATSAPALTVSEEDAAPSTQAPRRRRRTEQEPAPVSETTETPDEPSEAHEQNNAQPEDPAAPTNSEPAANIPSVVELRAKAQEKGTTAEGKQAIKALLDEFESKSIYAVPEEQRAEFLARLEAL